MTDAYLQDVPGVKDVRVRGGSLLPRRNVLEIDGARVYDDPVNGQTVIDIASPFVARSLVAADIPGADIDAFHAENDNADVYRFVGITDLLSLGAPRAGGRMKVVIINADPTDALDIAHQSGSASAAARFVTPGGSTFSVAANGGLCHAAYINSRWQILG